MSKKIVLISILFFQLAAWSEPQFALRTGLKCSQCHVNKSGGGKRTPFGVSFAQSQLSAGHLVPEDADFFSGSINENVSVGGNFRIDDKYSFKYSAVSPNTIPDTSAFGRDSTVIVTGEEGRTTAATEGNVYVHYQLIPQYFSLYLDQTVYPSNATREFFGMLEGLPYQSYVKYGHMLLPYGYRVIDDEDKAVIRAETGYSYGRSELAMEVGAEPGPTSFTVNLTRTNVSGVVQYIHPMFRVGLSGGQSLKGNFVKTGRNREYGVFAGFGMTNIALGDFYELPSVSIMLEVDEIKREDKSTEGNFLGTYKKRAYFSQLDLEVSPGVIFKTMYEVLHPDVSKDIKINGNTRLTLGVDYYPNPYLGLGLLYRYKEGIPQSVFWNQNDVIARIHFFM